MWQTDWQQYNGSYPVNDLDIIFTRANSINGDYVVKKHAVSPQNSNNSGMVAVQPASQPASHKTKTK